MGFFGGPSKKVLDNTTTGVASLIMQEYVLNKFKNNHVYNELFSAVVDTVKELKLGSLAKIKFHAVVRRKLILMGMPQPDADYVQGMLDIKLR